MRPFDCVHNSFAVLAKLFLIKHFQKLKNPSVRASEALSGQQLGLELRISKKIWNVVNDMANVTLVNLLQMNWIKR